MSNTFLKLVTEEVTPRQRWMNKLRSDPVKYEAFLEANRQKKNAKYQASRVGKEDLRAKVRITEDGRVCNSCNEPKSWDHFTKDIRAFNGKSAQCIECRQSKGREQYKNNPAVRRSGLKNRPDKLKRLYGIDSWSIVEAVLESQNGMCANAACDTKISLKVKGSIKGRAFIDHCHATGKFRALLCGDCNLVLGHIENKPKKITGLMDYVKKHKNQPGVTKNG